MAETTNEATKRNRRTVALVTESLTVTITEAGETKTFKLADIPTTLHNRLALHGLSQKLTDSTASLSDKAGYSLADRWKAIDTTYANLVKGEWASRSTGIAKTELISQGKEAIAQRYGAALQIIKGEVTGAVAHYAMVAFKLTDAMLEQIAKSNKLEWDGIKSETDDDNENEDEITEE